MEYHIDRRVILSEDAEFKSLYKWSLQELDTDGVKISRDLIPWDWSLYFHANELTLIDALAIKPNYDSDDGDKIAVRAKQSIKAKLTPKDTWGRGIYRDPTYSMFGTDRAISNFELQIEPLEAEDEEERCTAWGFVSYTSEVDFFDETIDDTVFFYLYLRPDRFAQYAAKIAANEVDVAALRVGGVAGFYAAWSPAISTDSIKVLCSHKEQEVEMPDGSVVAPPRLGRVVEAELYLQRVRELAVINPKSSGNNDSLEEDVLAELLPDEATLAAQNSVNASIRTIALLGSLRMAAWVIALLLLLILVT